MHTSATQQTLTPTRISIFCSPQHELKLPLEIFSCCSTAFSPLHSLSDHTVFFAILSSAHLFSLRTCRFCSCEILSSVLHAIFCANAHMHKIELCFDFRWFCDFNALQPSHARSGMCNQMQWQYERSMQKGMQCSWQMQRECEPNSIICGIMRSTYSIHGLYFLCDPPLNTFLPNGIPIAFI